MGLPGAALAQSLAQNLCRSFQAPFPSDLPQSASTVLMRPACIGLSTGSTELHNHNMLYGTFETMSMPISPIGGSLELGYDLILYLH